jgi:hypothetical protein
MLPKSMSMLVAVSVIFIGVMLLLGNMGVLPAQFVAMWPTVLIVAGLVAISCFDGERLKKLKPGASAKKSSKKK